MTSSLGLLQHLYLNHSTSCQRWGLLHSSADVSSNSLPSNLYYILF